MVDAFKAKNQGTTAEIAASLFLKKRGLLLLEKNYRSFCGELDLIMRDGDEIVFIEVRLRKNAAFGSGIESVSKAKQSKLIKTGLLYLQKKGWLDRVSCRFDVIGIDENNNLEWIQNAFGLGFV